VQASLLALKPQQLSALEPMVEQLQPVQLVGRHTGCKIDSWPCRKDTWLGAQEAGHNTAGNKMTQDQNMAKLARAKMTNQTFYRANPKKFIMK
jgi:hypothetical protein